MSPRAAAIKKAAPPSTSLAAGGLLQRKCDCGNSTMAGDECEECRKTKIQRKLIVGSSGDPLELEADRVADQVAGRMSAAPARVAVSGAQPRIRRYTGQPTGQADETPASVDRVLGSPGRPMEPALRQDMEHRFGHDFSRVRVHIDPDAARSAQDVGARAYTVGQNVVFGPSEYAPGTTAGRRLLAHELTHVVQAPVIPLIQRDVKRDAAGNPTDFEFRVGTELLVSFVRLAQQRAQNGIISDRDLRLLRTQALNRRGTLNDNERMFMAGLLDPGNVRKLLRTAVGPTTKITFSLASITTANMRHVTDLDRETLPPSVADPLREGGQALLDLRLADAAAKQSEAETAAEREILAHAGSFKSQATALIGFAKSQGVVLSQTLKAMLAAASDNSAGDRVLAGIAYAIAASSGNPMTQELLDGRIKVDALIPRAFGRLPTPVATVAFYVTAAQASGLKGDTMYLKTDIDITNLKDRSVVVHELRHAEEDRAASPAAAPSFPQKNRMELRGYRAQARYILDQMAGQSAAQRQTSAQQVRSAGGLVLGAALLEGQGNPARSRPLLELIFAAAPAPFTRSPAQVGQMLSIPGATIENALLQDIDTGYRLQPGETGVVEGLAGESLIHWIFRI